MYICIHISLLLECCMCGVPPARQETRSTSCSARAVMYHLCYVLRGGRPNWSGCRRNINNSHVSVDGWVWGWLQCYTHYIPRCCTAVCIHIGVLLEEEEEHSSYRRPHSSIVCCDYPHVCPSYPPLVPNDQVSVSGWWKGQGAPSETWQQWWSLTQTASSPDSTKKRYILYSFLGHFFGAKKNQEK